MKEAHDYISSVIDEINYILRGVKEEDEEEFEYCFKEYNQVYDPVLQGKDKDIIVCVIRLSDMVINSIKKGNIIADEEIKHSLEIKEKSVRLKKLIKTFTFAAKFGSV